MGAGTFLNISAITLFGIEFTIPMLIGIAAGIVAVIFAIIMIFVAMAKSKTDKPIKPIYDKRDPKTGKLIPEPVEEELPEETPADQEEFIDLDGDGIPDGVLVTDHVDESEFLDAELAEEPAKEEEKKEDVEEVPVEELAEEKPQEEETPASNETPQEEVPIEELAE